MLNVTSDQMDAFSAGQSQQYRDDLGKILSFEYGHIRRMQDQERLEFLDRTIADARKLGFSTKREILYFAMMAAEYGERFLQNSRYPLAREILTDARDAPLARLEKAEDYVRILAPTRPQ